MTTYQPPVRDFQFLLEEVFSAGDHLFTLPGFEEMDADVVNMVLEEGGKICSEVLHPINARGDQQGCRFDDGQVTAPDGFKEAYQTFTESGWHSLALPAEHGGQGLPDTLGFIIEEMSWSANTAFSLVSVLTRGACNLLYSFASHELKSAYLDRMVEGSWTGTMCLTESHAGTDLGLVKTRAVPMEDNSYAVSGTKIFITGGEHDLTDNIVHLVLARLPDAPAGVRGISLFLVPKRLPDGSGEAGEANGVTCGSIEHKMGINGSGTCVMNFDAAKGFLVGELNQGIPYMFKLMNVARLAIGLQGLGLGEVAYQNAVTYAKERLQTRALTGAKKPQSSADPIIVHPDVRRMLLTTRAYVEGCRAMSIWTGMQVDISHRHPDAEKREEAADLIELITPVFKAFCSDMGYETANLCQMVYGGHGYIRETGVEQFVRDARIAQIYEGTNGIQALDLVRRKLFIHEGRLPERLFSLMDRFIEDNASEAAMSEFLQPLEEALAQLRELTTWVQAAAEKSPDELGAASTDYLRLFALTTLAWFWARMARASLAGEGVFYETKLSTARFYFARLLPQVDGLDRMVRAGAATIMAPGDDSF